MSRVVSIAEGIQARSITIRDYLGLGSHQLQRRFSDVPVERMFLGARSVLKMFGDCSPELVLPMDRKAFRILGDVLKESGFAVAEWPAVTFQVRISDATPARFHHTFYGFQATSPSGRPLVVIKLPQHPARMFQADYGSRCGRAVRAAALQIAAGRPVDVTVTI